MTSGEIETCETAMQRLLALREEAQQIYDEGTMISIAYCLSQEQKLMFMEILMESSMPHLSH